MTKKLEKEFGLAPLEELKEKGSVVTKDVAKQKVSVVIDDESLTEHDDKMDLYAEEAHQYGKDIMDLGMGVEPRHSAEMFNAAAKMLQVAMDAKNSKLEKRLKLYDLELKRRKLEMEEARNNSGNIENYDDGSVYASREDLLNDED